MSDQPGSKLPVAAGDPELPHRRRRRASRAVEGPGQAGTDLISPQEIEEEIRHQGEGSETIAAGQSFAHPEQEFEHWHAIRAAVFGEFIQRTSGHDKVSTDALREEDAYMDLVNEVLAQNPVWLASIKPIDLGRLIDLLRTHQFGYGPLEDYMRLDGLEELYFNNHAQGFYIRHGSKRRIVDVLFADNDELVDFVKRVAMENGLEINQSRPNIDATLKDGSRLNATLPPLAYDGPDLVIRKHRDIPFTVEELLRRHTITQELATDLTNWVAGGLNIVVSGGTASGKTTFLNAVGNGCIPPGDRLLVIENRKELQIYTEDTKYFQTREDATRGDEKNDITVRDEIRWALRKRPDRIIVGELRGGEAFDALTAWNSGHNGSMCTIHANSAREAISKLEQLCGFSSTKPSESSVRSLIAESVDVVVQIGRTREGARQVVEVIQVLHPYKHDALSPELDGWVEEMKTKGILFPQRPGGTDIWIMPLYRVDGEGMLRKISQLIPLQGKTAR